MKVAKLGTKIFFANFIFFFNRSGWGKIWFDPNPPLFAHSVCVCQLVADIAFCSAFSAAIFAEVSG